MRGERERVGRKRGAVALRFYCCPWKGGSVMAERTLHTPLTDLPGVGPARRGPG